MPCDVVADFAERINERNDVDPAGCQNPSQGIGDFPDTQGQIFDAQGFNVIVSFANCNNDATIQPGNQSG